MKRSIVGQRRIIKGFMTIEPNFIGRFVIDVSATVECSQYKLIVVYFPCVGKKSSYFISILISHVLKWIRSLSSEQVYHHQFLCRDLRRKYFIWTPFCKIVQVGECILVDLECFEIDLIQTVSPHHYITVVT